MNKFIRQGDITFIRTEVVGEGTEAKRDEAGRLIIAHGESGHLHSVTHPEVTFMEREFDTDTGIIGWIVAPDEISVDHEEHNVIQLPPGVWVVRVERQYRRGQIERVLD